MDDEMLRDFGVKAKADGQFAIAYAILKLTSEFREYRQAMTFGPENTQHRYPGIGEKIGMELDDLQQNIGAIASALQQIADRE